MRNCVKACLAAGILIWLFALSGCMSETERLTHEYCERQLVHDLVSIEGLQACVRYYRDGTPVFNEH